MREDMDELIESALRGESIRPVPLGFHRRVEERLRLLQLLDRERAKWRRAAGLCVGALFLMVCLGAGLTVGSNAVGQLAQAVPGFLGHMDASSAFAARWWPVALGFGAIASCASAVSLFAVESLRFRRAMAMA